jgi:hypothetical protein
MVMGIIIAAVAAVNLVVAAINMGVALRLGTLADRLHRLADRLAKEPPLVMDTATPEEMRRRAGADMAATVRAVRVQRDTAATANDDTQNGGMR